jgi:hypothetical protein
MDKLWYILRMEYYSPLKSNELLSHEETYVLLYEARQSEDDSNCSNPVCVTLMKYLEQGNT